MLPQYDTLDMTYSDYISLLLVCGDCPPTSKTGGCWNMLESTLARITLIKSSQKCTRMLFIISNSKLGIWICSQPRIDLNPKSNFNDVLTIPYKYLVQHTIQNNRHGIQYTCQFHQVMRLSRYYQANLFSSTSFIDNILSSWQQSRNI